MSVICGIIALFFLALSIFYTLCHIVCKSDPACIPVSSKLTGFFFLLAIGWESFLVILAIICFLVIFRPFQCSHVDNFVRQHQCLVDTLIFCCCPCRRPSNAVLSDGDMVMVVVMDSVETSSIPGQNTIPSRSTVHRLKGTVIDVGATPASSVSAQLEEDQAMCPICFESKSHVWFRTQCGHEFHHKCLSDWTQDSCPYCREPIWKK